MKPHLGLAGLVTSGAVVLMASQPAQAAATQITGVQVFQTAVGMELVLQTRNGDRPQVFAVNRGNTLVADITNAQLRLPEGNGYLQNNPAPGISSVMVTQLDPNSVRVAVMGAAAPPANQVRQDGTAIVFSLTADGTGVGSLPSQPSFPSAQVPPPTLPGGSTFPSNPAIPPSQVLVPNPQVSINGTPVSPSGAFPGQVPPLLPRAVAPPVGDIAVATTDVSPTVIDLGTSEIVPRLVLRDAPVRDVLSLLGRAAGLNVAYLDRPSQTEGVDAQSAQETSAAADARISLDIENEPVQNVFNYVLRISGLDANLVGRTIFVGTRLPNSARSVVSRTLRLNQASVGAALNFLVGLGAETAVSRRRQVVTATAVPVQGGDITAGVQAAGPTQVQTTEEDRLEVQRVDYQDATPLLRGLQVIGDERTRSITMVGTPRQIEIATAQLSQLDVRQRQVAVNIRVIDINLRGIDRAGTSFSFGIDDTRVIQDSGQIIVNFGSAGGNTGRTPASVISSPELITRASEVVLGRPTNAFDFTRNFLAQLRFAITSGNAKILTDPTLVVQEGQEAQIQLTEDVITNLEVETSGTGNDRTQTVTLERTPAGLVLNVRVEGIDDNGFVSLSVGPTISAPLPPQEVRVLGTTVQIIPLAVRRVSSGIIRVRDGQTLILSGIIQDRDRAEVTKVPILGDIPILGALFRSTRRENQRQEVIVMLTPQIIDDSDTSTFGYRYVPSRDVQQILERGRR
ncbi:AMIN domain-containing protein [Thermoleptolyngbya sp. M55_K2018_002]|uniref:AMIN domain-containing protein n=1 Tax=Thermoleptolyngbya sp. M55_K2018_002 TaxID=2747808 RepID=UPI0025F1A8FB|nr:AMIN domain-containing protein [Thermoleptolyngbya sp. M55_K2018_002]